MQLQQCASDPRPTDSTPVRTLALSFRWKCLVETGKYETFAELVRNKEVNSRFVPSAFS